jgi:peroxisome-assembly ATPase
MVSTSNRPPETLYENGLNRSVFLPFIAQLKKQSEVWKMEGTEDYRMLDSKDRQRTFFTDQQAFQDEVDRAKAGRNPIEHVIPVMMGRKLSLPALDTKEGETLVFSTFSNLCTRNLGAADYIALCREAKTIFMDDLRAFRARDLDYARRFITLVDAAYESGTKLGIHSSAPLDSLFKEITEAEKRRAGRMLHSNMQVKKGGGSSSSMMSTFVNGDTEWSATGLSEASLATGGAGETDVSFAVGRAVSRLYEMGSNIYQRRH